MPRLKTKPLPFMGEPQIARFHRKHSTGEGCWEWQGATRRGYGVFSLNGVDFVASRVALAIATGFDPGDKIACHSCDNPSCVNPHHLWEGSDLDNVRDMLTKGRGKFQIGNPDPAKWNGCEHSRSDVYVDPHGGVRCRPCLLERDARACRRRAEARRKRNPNLRPYTPKGAIAQITNKA